MTIRGRNCFSSILSCSALIILLPSTGATQGVPPKPSETGLTVSQVVAKLVEKNSERSSALERYQGRRSYRLDYAGFPEDLHAEMIVDMNYKAPDTKKFTVVSQSGSKWIINHIFKRLLESEREALAKGNLERTALTSQNYDFTMLADKGAADECPYVLAVQPKALNKFLFRGRIWVDAKDFAVCRIEVEPAENPSFWIKKTEIHHSYLKKGNFWLPAENKSVSTIRLGGRAVLTIKYEDYKILQARALNETHTGSASLPSTAPGRPN